MSLADLKYELRGYWQTRSSAFSHDGLDDEIQRAEWGDLPNASRLALGRAGFHCRTQVEECPTWLLMTLPGIGTRRLTEIRRVLPFRQDRRWWRRDCPGRWIERQRDRVRVEAEQDDGEHILA